jgi:oligopeptide transport system permease protein
VLKHHFPLVLVLAIVVLAPSLPLLLPWSYEQIDWDAVRAPAFSGSHIFGTDEIGRIVWRGWLPAPG